MSSNKTSVWREGKFVDLWSLVHFLTGIAVGGAFLFLHINSYIASAIAVGLFAGWEIFEPLIKIHEQSTNHISDVIIDYIGFFIAQLYVFAWRGIMYWYIPTVVAFIALTLMAWGLIDFKKRKNKN
jgi:hypothetical protein